MSSVDCVVGLGVRDVNDSVHGFVGRVYLRDKGGDGVYRDVATGDGGVCRDVHELGDGDGGWAGLVADLAMTW